MFFRVGSIDAKVQCSKFDAILNFFFMFKALKYVEWATFFFQMSFSLLNVHYSSSKLKSILTFMINKTKKTQIGEIYFYNTFENIWFKHDFNLKTYEF